MSKLFEQFNSLHQADSLFVLPNAWDAKSAMLLSERFPAIGTSSAAVASALGYDDGEQMSFSEYLFVVNRMLSAISRPLTVDIEMGYGQTNEEILENLYRLVEAGVAGINIEDSAMRNAKRSLQDAESFAKRIQYIRSALDAAGRKLFINVRCDTYLLHVADKQNETQKRLHLYEASGANGIFLPGITNEHDIAGAIAHTSLPLNVMCIPGLPDFRTLNRLGVKRVSMGPFMFNKIYAAIGDLSRQIVESGNFSPIMG